MSATPTLIAFDAFLAAIDDAKISGFSLHQFPDGQSALFADAKADFTPKSFSEKKAINMETALSRWSSWEVPDAPRASLRHPRPGVRSAVGQVGQRNFMPAASSTP